MFLHLFCLCSLILIIKLNFNISKVAYWVHLEVNHPASGKTGQRCSSRRPLYILIFFLCGVTIKVLINRFVLVLLPCIHYCTRWFMHLTLQILLPLIFPWYSKAVMSKNSFHCFMKGINIIEVKNWYEKRLEIQENSNDIEKHCRNRNTKSTELIICEK